ncbi:MAG: hypothetical protein WDM81_01870 [Rhizomicrobium sp.]
MISSAVSRLTISKCVPSSSLGARQANSASAPPMAVTISARM